MRYACHLSMIFACSWCQCAARLDQGMEPRLPTMAATASLHAIHSSNISWRVPWCIRRGSKVFGRILAPPSLLHAPQTLTECAPQTGKRTLSGHQLGCCSCKTHGQRTADASLYCSCWTFTSAFSMRQLNDPRSYSSNYDTDTRARGASGTHRTTDITSGPAISHAEIRRADERESTTTLLHSMQIQLCGCILTTRACRTTMVNAINELPGMADLDE